MGERQYYTDIISGLAERTIKRLWIVIVLLIVLLFGSHAAWIYYESHWETIETTIEAQQYSDDGGSNYAIGGDLYDTAER